MRVGLLAGAIVLLSGADLYLTLLYLTHTGMSEANPLARTVMAYRSPAMLAAWKGLTVALCVGILLRARERACAEAAAWAGLGVLTLLSAHWARYADSSLHMTDALACAAEQSDPRFVRLGGATP